MNAPIQLGAIEPSDAVAAFQQRGLLRPTFRWQDVWQAEHCRCFAAAGVMRLDVLALLREATSAAVADGTAFADFRDAVRRQLVAKGFWGDVDITDPASGEQRTTRFDDARLRLIYDVNLRQSHAAGRWARGTRSRLMTHIVYRTMGDERVRASHRPWDWVCLPKDHPWWDTHTPPNGWRCRCHFYFTDARGIEQLRAAGRPLKTEPPPTEWVEWENRSTGAVERVPRGIDPGFAYNPGKVHVQRSVELLERGLASVRPTSKGAGDAGAVTRAVIARMRSESAFADFLAAPPPRLAGVGLPVAALPAGPGEPAIASVQASDLVEQAARGDYPPPLPVLAKGWALAQAIVDQGQRLDLGGGRVLWWWARGEGDERRVLALELERSPLVWWVQQLATLSVREARERYPRLQGLL